MTSRGIYPTVTPPPTKHVASRRLNRDAHARSNRHEPSIHPESDVAVHDNDDSASSVADAAGI
jgi:hypothetical protein